MNTEKLFLCRPCAEKLKTFKTVKSVKLGAPHKQKAPVSNATADDTAMIAPLNLPTFPMRKENDNAID